jgi:metal-sulfur cluster biosynthetic enzyme
MITKKQIEHVLKKIPDPELGVSIWDLGLIYRIDIDPKKGIVGIVITLTSMGCPLFDVITSLIQENVGKIKGVKKVDIDLTFEPPWTPDKMSKEAKMQMGL